MKVMISGGGTGGHVYPAIAIADKIMRKEPDSSILFVGTKVGLESVLVPERGYQIKHISAKGFNRKNPFQILKTIFATYKGYKEAGEIIDEFQPEKVVGTGGYVSLPALYAAVKKGIPIYIHEQNAYPGLANKFLSSYARKVFISFPEAEVHFKKKDNIVLTGNPLRKEFLLSDIFDYREKLGIKDSEFLLVSFGGSRGAARINETIGEMVEVFEETPGIRLVHITGKPYYDAFVKKYMGVGQTDSKENPSVKDSEKVKILPYTDKIHEYMDAADLIISRAGAITVSEIAALGKPAVFIPSPNVTANHQKFNAKTLADRGGAILVEEKDLSSQKIKDIVLRLKNNKEALNSMAKASGALGFFLGADEIYKGIKEKEEA